MLRKYLKKGKLDEFERLAAYADLWGVADDNTRILQALTIFRNHMLVQDEPMYRNVRPTYDEEALRV